MYDYKNPCIDNFMDDRTMIYAAHHALMETNAKNNASNMVAFFDAEEETNSALGGADTPFFRNVLTKA